MTGFAHAEGTAEELAWTWELRSVNGRGLDVRFRLPTGWDSLEAGLREQASQMLKRGNVTAKLIVKRQAEPRLAPDPAALEEVVELALRLAERIPGSAPPRADALLALPGVLRPATEPEAGDEAVVAPVRAGFAAALRALVEARRAEGTRLAGVIHRLLDEIATLLRAAHEEAADQPRQQRERLLESVQVLLRDQPGLPEERIAQEVALLAARSDVREELDRLASHLDAARALLAEGTAIGRRFDFLVQECNREANTLCSKSASSALTATGLRLKASIEQLREQLQNIE